MLGQLYKEMKNKGFSEVEKLKDLNFYFKTWDGFKVDELASYNKETYIEFILENSVNMSNLEKVDLWGFPSVKLEQFLSGIRSLKKIKNTQGKYPFPKSILLNKDLEELSLTLTPIKKMPKGIGDLNNLRKIDLAQTDVEELPEEIGKLKELEELIVHAKLKTVHSTIASNLHLKKLDFGSNKIAVLPAGIFELKSLESLDLSGNPIENFDFQVAKWPKINNLMLAKPLSEFTEITLNYLRKHFRKLRSQEVQTVYTWVIPKAVSISIVQKLLTND